MPMRMASCRSVSCRDGHNLAEWPFNGVIPKVVDYLIAQKMRKDSEDNLFEACAEIPLVGIS
jgi:hypothetical protein